MHFLTSVLAVLVVSACSSSPVKESTPANATPQAPTATAPAAASSASAPAQASPTKVICKMGTDERTLESAPTASGCELKYTKFGQTSVAASSAFSTTHCDRIREQIKTNLGKFGFTCE